MTRSRNQPPTPRPTVLYQRMADGSAVLVETEAGDVYAVNATAADIWELCDGRRSPTAIAAALRERYDAPLAEVRRGVTALLAHLRHLGVLVESASGSAAPR